MTILDILLALLAAASPLIVALLVAEWVSGGKWPNIFGRLFGGKIKRSYWHGWREGLAQGRRDGYYESSRDHYKAAEQGREHRQEVERQMREQFVTMTDRVVERAAAMAEQRDDAELAQQIRAIQYPGKEDDQ